MGRDTHSEAGEIVVELEGQVADDLVSYAREKLRAALAHTALPVLHVRVRVIRHADPARQRPVEVSMNVNLNGTPVPVHVEATTPREGIDRLVDRLKHRLEREG